MRRLLDRAGVKIVLGALLPVACASPDPAQVASQGTAAAASSADSSPATAIPPEAANDVLYRKARQFDFFLAGELDADEVTELERECHTRPQENPFCFSIMNRDRLEERRAPASSLAKSGYGRSKGVVRARFQRRRLMNWLELRFAPVGALIRGVSSAKPSELEYLRKRALKETRCPNNVAIAVAATLEDQLSEGLGYDDVANLYLKGGDCLVGSPADRENLLTRAGLFFFAKEDYKNAARIFVRASTLGGEAFVTRPLYWLYRTHLETKQNQKAHEVLEELKAKYPFSFHTLIALTARGEDPGTVLNRSGAPPITRSVQSPDINHLIEQTEILRRFGFQQSAKRVLDWAIRMSQDVEPEVRIYLAELKRDQGDYHSKIAILSDVLYKNPDLVARNTLELYFPKVFFPIFEKHSPVIDPYLLIAVARRESAFRSGAISGANAQGLLQVLPSTGRRIAGDVNLLDPNTNVEVGARYLTELLRKSQGQIHLALAAYNAGPGKVSAWTDRYPARDPILFIDLIPYRETREYVASVLRNYYWYRRIHKNDDKITPRRLITIATGASSSPRPQ